MAGVVVPADQREHLIQQLAVHYHPLLPIHALRVTGLYIYVFIIIIYIYIYTMIYIYMYKGFYIYIYIYIYELVAGVVVPADQGEHLAQQLAIHDHPLLHIKFSI